MLVCIIDCEDMVVLKAVFGHDPDVANKAAFVSSALARGAQLLSKILERTNNVLLQALILVPERVRIEHFGHFTGDQKRFCKKVFQKLAEVRFECYSDR